MSFAVRSVFIVLILAVGASAQTGTISGRVTYGEDVALHDANVQITQTRQSVLTDDQGNYRISDVPPGRYTLLVHLEGFTDSTRTVVVAAGGTHQIDFRLQIASLTEQVTITASGTEQSIFDSFQSVNSVGSTRIAEKASTSLGEVLETETGMAKRSFGPGSSRPIIRGFDGDRVLILQDGVRSGSVGSQSGDHAEPIDPLAAERIEVVKGPGTLLYGSNALGGVVNVIGHHENQAYDGIRGYATVVGGTADKLGGLSAGIEYGVKHWLLRGSFGAQRTGDYETPIGVVPNSASRSHSGSFGGGYYGKKAWASAMFSADIRRYGIPFAGEFHADHEDEIFGGEGEDHAVDVDLRSRKYNFRISGGFRELENSFLSSIQYNFDYSAYRHKEIEIDTDLGVEAVGTIFDNKTVSVRSLFELNKFGRLTGRFGFEGFARNYLVTGEEQLIAGKVKQNSFSVFGLEELDYGRFKFQFGGRVEHNGYRPEDPLLTGRSFTGVSGGAGVNVGLWEGGVLVANYTHSFRAPALEELYNNGPHVGNLTFEIGNSALTPERSNGLDISLRHQSDRFRFTADVYYYRISDFIFLSPRDLDSDGEVDVIDGLPVAVYSQADAEYLGGELAADVTFNSYVSGFVSLDTVRAKLVEDDIYLPRIPPARARVGLDLKYKDLSIRPEAVFAAAQDRLFPLETRTAGYGIFNIAGSYTISRQHVAHVISFNAYNLTDKLYRNHPSFIKELAPEMGRGIRFGYTVRFF